MIYIILFFLALGFFSAAWRDIKKFRDQDKEIMRIYR